MVWMFVMIFPGELDAVLYAFRVETAPRLTSKMIQSYVIDGGQVARPRRVTSTRIFKKGKFPLSTSEKSERISVNIVTSYTY